MYSVVSVYKRYQEEVRLTVTVNNLFETNYRTVQVAKLFKPLKTILRSSKVSTVETNCRSVYNDIIIASTKAVSWSESEYKILEPWDDNFVLLSGGIVP